MDRPHVTVSWIPFGTFACGAVLGPGYFKLILLVIEVGVCWTEHEERPR